MMLWLTVLKIYETSIGFSKVLFENYVNVSYAVLSYRQNKLLWLYELFVI